MSSNLLIESLVIELEAVVVCAPHDEINEQSCPLRDTGQTRSVPFEMAVLGPACTDGYLMFKKLISRSISGIHSTDNYLNFIFC